MTFDRVILIDKPTGMTSFGVVARVRRQLTEQAGRKVKVGHTGTLDPFATGLLILLSGKMTKKSNDFLKLDKTYEATIVLGKTSTTGDPEGEITANEALGHDIPKMGKVETVLNEFVGKITQIPPIYSAIKINGQRAYKLAREGKNPEIPEREVEIHFIDIIDYDYPELKIRVSCSSGTYIRTLAEDIGKKLGVGAYTKELRRVKVGEYDVGDADKSFVIE